MFKTKKLKASKNEMKHSSRGIFKYERRRPVEMVKGGHGQKNIEYLKKNNFEHSVNRLDNNGVRHGNIKKHVRKREQTGDGHVWFPESWSDKKIKKAGEHVANLKTNRKKPDHTPMHGKYKGVHVVTYKSRGRICGICPKFKQN